MIIKQILILIKLRKKKIKNNLKIPAVKKKVLFNYKNNKAI